MPYLVTIENPANGERGTLRVEARRGKLPRFLIATDTDTGAEARFPIVAHRWVSKHSPEAQPSPRSIAKRQARERYLAQ